MLQQVPPIKFNNKQNMESDSNKASSSRSKHSRTSSEKHSSYVSSQERSRYSRVSDMEEAPKRIPISAASMVVAKSKSTNRVEDGPKDIVNVKPGEVRVNIEPVKVQRVIISREIDHETHGCLHMYEKYPCVIIVMVLILSLSCAGWVLFTGQIKYSTPNERDFLVRNEYTSMLYDAVYLAQAEVYNMQAEPIQKQTQVNDEWTTHLVVVSKIGKTVFTQENIKVIRRIADQVRSMPEIEQFCLKDKNDDSRCSPIEFMRGVVFSFGDDMENDEVQRKLKELQEFPENRAYLEKHITLTGTYSNLTRVIFRFAMPITVEGKDYKDRYDREEEQIDKFKEFSLKMKQFVEQVNDPELKFYLYSDALYEKIYIDTIIDDSEFLSFTGVFLFCYLWFRCKSFFLSICGFLQVILSFPIAYMLYKPLFGIAYIGIVHLIAVYIGLVVSVENIIIFIGNWRHSKRRREYKKLLRMRMYYAIRKSFGAITSSSIVTALAFFSAGFCEIIPISSFGFAMALIILVNYILLHTYFPCIILFYWKYLRKLFDCIDWIRKLVNPTHEKYQIARRKTQIYKGQQDSSGGDERISPQLGKDITYRKNSEITSQDSRQSINSNLGVLESFFEKCFAPTLYRISVLVLVLLLGLLIAMIYFSAKIPGVSKPEQLLPASYDISYSRSLVKEAFGHGEGDENIVVRFVYGIKEVDSSGIEFYNADNIGKIVWDPEFNLSDPESQVYLSDLCYNLKMVILSTVNKFIGHQIRQLQKNRVRQLLYVRLLNIRQALLQRYRSFFHNPPHRQHRVRSTRQLFNVPLQVCD
eukprot:TRINITY_DN71172_c0_g1_i1.p1 TRINITY_DN71172_c0_g1~~TRINITY_DN71172_c0_g1_i1.p1  ORF type:complete len:810 (+),score=47.03 TRINITY_DN71172_c0_g1_i1:130-2559(+)